MPEIRVNVTEEVAEGLEGRARAHGLEVTEYVSRLLSRDVAGSAPPVGGYDAASAPGASPAPGTPEATGSQQTGSLQEHFDSGWSSLSLDEAFDAEWDKKG